MVHLSHLDRPFCGQSFVGIPSEGIGILVIVSHPAYSSTDQNMIVEQQVAIYTCIHKIQQEVKILNKIFLNVTMKNKNNSISKNDKRYK